DQRKGLAALDVEGDAVDGFEEFEVAALDHAVEPGFRDVEDAAQVFHVDIGGHAALSLAEASKRRQATDCEPCRIGSGRSTGQRSKTKPQRGLKEQPGGIAESRGIEPGICTSRLSSPASVGIAPIRPFA